MSFFNSISEKLHSIKVRLYENYLKSSGVEGDYIARTNSEASLLIEQICAAMKNRGGFTGNYEVLQENVRQFLDETAYQLCDGYAVNLKYFSIHPNVGGTFNSVNEGHDPDRNPITFRFRTLPAMRRLVEHIEVRIDGLANASAWIDSYEDMETETTNTSYVPGNLFVLNGSKIKIAGDDPACGLYFVPTDDPATAVKVTRIAENNPSSIIGIAPKMTSTHSRIEVRTQFSGSSTRFLKNVRTITSDFELEETI